MDLDRYEVTIRFSYLTSPTRAVVHHHSKDNCSLISIYKDRIDDWGKYNLHENWEDKLQRAHRAATPCLIIKGLLGI